MKFLLIIMLNVFLAAPAFAGTEFCEIAHPEKCSKQLEKPAGADAAPISLTNPAKPGSIGYQKQSSGLKTEQDAISFLDLEFAAAQTPSYRR